MLGPRNPAHGGRAYPVRRTGWERRGGEHRRRSRCIQRGGGDPPLWMRSTPSYRLSQERSKQTRASGLGSTRPLGSIREKEGRAGLSSSLVPVFDSARSETAGSVARKNGARRPPRRSSKPKGNLSLIELGQLVVQFPQIDWSPVLEPAAAAGASGLYLRGVRGLSRPPRGLLCLPTKAKSGRDEGTGRKTANAKPLLGS
jgi:hypothetical protein